MKAILAIAIFFGGVSAWAGKACFCEIGSYPAWQQGFFKAGCGMWFGSVSGCTTTETVMQGYNYSDKNFDSSITSIEVGFVGHWDSSYSTVSHLRNYIVPVMQKYGISARYDNTACLSMSNPQEVQDYIQTLKLPANQTLEVKGNQVLSVGKWDALLGSNMNFPAWASSKFSAPKLMSCRDVENTPCLSMIHQGARGHCDNENAEPSELTCCVAKPDTSDFGAQQGPEEYKWLQRKDCSR